MVSLPPIDLPGYRCRNRMFEWSMTAAMIMLGVQLLIWPGSLGFSHFAPILDVMSPFTIAIFCLFFGALRAVALWRNGTWPKWGPTFRALGAIAGAVILISIDVALIRQSLEVNRPPSPGVPFYTVFFVGELRSVRRAKADARSGL